MGRRPSRKSELQRLREELRRAGWTYQQIAAHIRREHRVNARVGFRLAHGLTQTEVAERWNAQWPDDATPKTAQHVSYWETWPLPGGRTPSLDTLNRLAYLYLCSAGDLLDGADYSHCDPAAGQLATVEEVPAQRPPLSMDDIVSTATVRYGASLALPGASDVVAIPEDQAVVHGTFAAQLLHQANALVTEGAVLSARQRDAAFKQLVTFLSTWAHTMNRREILSILGWAATAAAAAPAFDVLSSDEQARLARAIQTPSRVDDRVIDHIEDVLWRCIHQDDALGPQAALDTLLAQRNLARLMLAECSPNLRPRLLSVFANLSRYAGWLAFDLNDFDSASYYYEQARSAAHEAQNTELGALVLCNLSHLATWQHQPRVGIDHAVAAQSWARRTDDHLLQAYAADVAARANAMDGEFEACMAELDIAEAGIASARERPAPSLVHFYDEGLLASVRGLCLLQCQRPREAAAATRESLAALGPSFVRNRAITTLDLGVAYIHVNEIDQAATEVGNAAYLALHNRSARLVEQVHVARAQLAPWQDSGAVRELDQRLAAYHLVS